MSGEGGDRANADSAADENGAQGRSSAELAAIVLALLGETGLDALSGRLSPGNEARLKAALEPASGAERAEQRAVAAAFALELAERLKDRPAAQVAPAARRGAIRAALSRIKAARGASPNGQDD